MNKNTFYKVHGGGLVTLLSSPSRVKPAEPRHTEHDQKQLENHLFWNDRKREREEQS